MNLLHDQLDNTPTHFEVNIQDDNFSLVDIRETVIFWAIKTSVLV